VSTYARPHRTFQDQLDQLEARRLNVGDQTTALAYLRQLGYYRLSAYWYPLRKREVLTGFDGRLRSVVREDFQDGASFEQAVRLYQFDKQLRALLMEAIEHIEVAFRVDIAYHLGQQATFAQAETSLLDANFTRRNSHGPSAHERWLLRHDNLVARSKEDFVRHYKSKYGEPLPIWVSIELWDFGLLSNFFAGMRFLDQEALCIRMGVKQPTVMKSWLRTINYLRNIVAHHSRLWNRNMIDQPKLPRAGEIAAFDELLAQQRKGHSVLDVSRPYPAFCIVAYLLSKVCPTSDWHTRLAGHLARFPSTEAPVMDVSRIGCHPGWEDHPFWH
jgi:abortive infection bacteriophage resistance protein